MNIRWWKIPIYVICAGTGIILSENNFSFLSMLKVTIPVALVMGIIATVMERLEK